jgi:hypothetical protein
MRRACSRCRCRCYAHAVSVRWPRLQEPFASFQFTMSNSGALPRDALLRQYVQMAEIEIDHSRRGPRGRRPARYVFLGDYIDRGPDSRGGVIQLLMRRQQAQPGTSVCLRGNHAANGDYGARERARPAVVAAERGGAATQCNYSARMAGSRTPISRGCALCRSATTWASSERGDFLPTFRVALRFQLALLLADRTKHVLAKLKATTAPGSAIATPGRPSLDNAGTR